MPKVLALAVNFGVAPFLFLQVLYGHFLYPSIVLMAVWWMFVALFAMLAYYGLYVSDGAVRPARRTPILFLSALLLLMTAFLLSNASTLMLRPDFWFRWFSEPHGHLLNTSDPTLFPRYLHILLASLAVGGLTMAWRAGGASVIRKWTGKRPSAVSAGGWIGFSTFPWRRFRWGCCSCSHCPRMCAAFFWRRRAVHGGPDFSRIRAVHRPHPWSGRAGSSLPAPQPLASFWSWSACAAWYATPCFSPTAARRLRLPPLWRCLMARPPPCRSFW